MEKTISKWLAGVALALACALAAPAAAYAAAPEGGVGDGQEPAQVVAVDEANGGSPQTAGTVGTDGMESGSANGEAGAPAQGGAVEAGNTEGNAAEAGGAAEDGTANGAAVGDEATAPETPAGGANATPETPETPVDGESSSVGDATQQPEADEGFVLPEGAVLYTVQYESTVKVQEEPETETAPSFKLKVQGHVQNKGWMSAKTANAGGSYIQIGVAGLRLEQLRFTLLGLPSGVSGGVQVQAHVQNVGWQAVTWAKGNGKVAECGTSGRALRIEAVRIILTGDISQWYDVKYKARIQKKGWLADESNGKVAGVTGQGLRLEQLRIWLDKKAAKAATPSSGIVNVRARSHVQNIGWQSVVQNGSTSGTSGRSLRIEALSLGLDAGTYGGTIWVNAYVQGKGWSNYKKNVAGTTGQSKRMEGVRIELRGGIANQYDVMYRAHVQNIGWQPWAVNGGTVGAPGKKLRIEALQVKLVRKGSSAPEAGATYFISFSGDVNKTLSNASVKAKQQTQTGAYADNLYERYYMRKEGSYVSLQNVFSGKFLANNAGVVRQVVDQTYGADAQLWQFSKWDGGYTLTNKADGTMLSYGSDGATSAAKGKKWTFLKTTLIPNGNYYMQNQGASKRLTVNGTGYADEAKLSVKDHNPNNKGSQVFTFTNKGGEVYFLQNTMSYRGIEVNGANVRQQDPTGTAVQKWTASMSRSGGLQFTNTSNKKMLMAAGSGANGANATTGANTEKATQRWTLLASGVKTDSAYVRAFNHIKNRASGTRYMIVLDQTAHKVFIFDGSPGRWSLIIQTLVSVGKPEHRTPTGERRIYRKKATDGDGNYVVYYYSMFKSDNAFHSIKYYPNSMRVKDGRLGRDISMGCVRMPYDIAKWIYMNCDIDTHVSSYR